MALEDAVDTFESGMSILFSEPEINVGHYGQRLKITFPTLKPMEISLPDVDSSNVALFAHHVWKSSILLSKLIINEPSVVESKKILEFGAGHGIPSIVAALLGGIVTSSDYPDADLIDKLNLNMKNNKVEVKVVPHAWGSKDSPLNGLFDVVIMADTLWMAHQHHNLLNDLEKYLDRDGIILGVAGLHSGKFVIDSFFIKAKERGFEVNELVPYRIPLGNGLGEDLEWLKEEGEVVDEPGARNRHLYAFKLSRKSTS